jgi:hypothetical protein
MKKGQGPIGIILGLAVIVFLLIVIAWAFRPTTTGQVISDNEANEKSNFISEPFELRAWVVNNEGVQVDIQNSGTEDYLINSVEVKGCGFTEYGKRLNVGESWLFPISCNLNPGEKFRGIVIVNYSPVEGGVEKNSFGSIEDIV